MAQAQYEFKAWLESTYPKIQAAFAEYLDNLDHPTLYSPLSDLITQHYQNLFKHDPEWLTNFMQNEHPRCLEIFNHLDSLTILALFSINDTKPLSCLITGLQNHYHMDSKRFTSLFSLFERLHSARLSSAPYLFYNAILQLISTKQPPQDNTPEQPQLTHTKPLPFDFRTDCADEFRWFAYYLSQYFSNPSDPRPFVLQLKHTIEPGSTVRIPQDLSNNTLSTTYEDSLLNPPPQSATTPHPLFTPDPTAMHDMATIATTPYQRYFLIIFLLGNPLSRIASTCPAPIRFSHIYDGLNAFLHYPKNQPIALLNHFITLFFKFYTFQINNSPPSPATLRQLHRSLLSPSAFKSLSPLLPINPLFYQFLEHQHADFANAHRLDEVIELESVATASLFPLFYNIAVTGSNPLYLQTLFDKIIFNHRAHCRSSFFSLQALYDDHPPSALLALARPSEKSRVRKSAIAFLQYFVKYSYHQFQHNSSTQYQYLYAFILSDRLEKHRTGRHVVCKCSPTTPCWTQPCGCFIFFVLLGPFFLAHYRPEEFDDVLLKQHILLATQAAFFNPLCTPVLQQRTPVYELDELNRTLIPIRSFVYSWLMVKSGLPTVFTSTSQSGLTSMFHHILTRPNYHCRYAGESLTEYQPIDSTSNQIELNLPTTTFQTFSSFGCTPARIYNVQNPLEQFDIDHITKEIKTFVVDGNGDFLYISLVDGKLDRPSTQPLRETLSPQWDGGLHTFQFNDPFSHMIPSELFRIEFRTRQRYFRWNSNPVPPEYEKDFPHRLQNPANIKEISLIESSENRRLLKSPDIVNLQRKYKKYRKEINALEQQRFSEVTKVVVQKSHQACLFRYNDGSTSTSQTSQPMAMRKALFPHSTTTNIKAPSSQAITISSPTYPFSEPSSTNEPDHDWFLEMFLVATLGIQPPAPLELSSYPFQQSSSTSGPARSVPLTADAIASYFCRPENNWHVKLQHIKEFDKTTLLKTQASARDQNWFLFDSLLNQIYHGVISSHQSVFDLKEL